MDPSKIDYPHRETITDLLIKMSPNEEVRIRRLVEKFYRFAVISVKDNIVSLYAKEFQKNSECGSNCSCNFTFEAQQQFFIDYMSPEYNSVHEAIFAKMQQNVNSFIFGILPK